MYEDVIAQVPLFSDLARRELQVLSANCREREYPAGEVLLHQGETGVGLFIVTEGTVHVTQQSPEGEQRDLGTFERGAVLGEMSLLDDLPRTATVTAQSAVKALVIPVWDFRAALRDTPEISIKLLSVLSRRLRRLETNPAQPH